MGREVIEVDSSASDKAFKKVKNLRNRGRRISQELMEQLEGPDITAYKQAQADGRQILVVDVSAELTPPAVETGPLDNTRSEW